MNKKTKQIIFVGLPLLAIGLYFVLRKKTPTSTTTPTPPINPNQGGGGVSQGGGTSNLNFRQMADDLFDNMNGCGTAWDDGTSDGIVGKMSQLRSNADFDALVSAYGSRTITCWLSSSYTGNLVGALQSELSSGEIEEINNILSSNGITKMI